MTVYTVLLILHLLAATFWVGGMACMHFAVRPTAISHLDPAQRLPFLTAALGRFLHGVAAAIAVLLLTGLAMVFAQGGFGAVHWSVHAMATLGLLMMAVFGHIRWAAYPRLQQAVRSGQWQAAASVLQAIGRWVATNLGLGVAVYTLATLGRML
ncbi:MULTISPECIES: CopD family protein [Caldimonas]|uniref:CopD family protein n=1 Tax=Caldimonas TaxID=196013 RepID=UPI0003623D6A|nr:MULTISPECIES: CopD family protein [Caldimonas]GIX25892.1 MAG: hypothetical protein KatS3mg122_3123 [Caldimonas sp.]